MTDFAGTVRARYDYDPWGRTMHLEGDLNAEFGFTGHYHHLKSGLYLAPFRAYSPENGRWLNRDPIQEGDGPNMYGYVSNQVVNAFDLSGLFMNKLRKIIGGIAKSAGVLAPCVARCMEEMAKALIAYIIAASGLASIIIGIAYFVPLVPKSWVSDMFKTFNVNYRGVHYLAGSSSRTNIARIANILTRGDKSVINSVKGLIQRNASRIVPSVLGMAAMKFVIAAGGGVVVGASIYLYFFCLDQCRKNPCVMDGVPRKPLF